MNSPGTKAPEMSSRNDISVETSDSPGSPGSQIPQTKGRLQISPGMTEYYVPECEPSITPHVGQNFKSLEDGIKFYREYADAGGFTVRLGSQKISSVDNTTITLKRAFCNKQGFNPDKTDANTAPVDANKKSRKKASIRIGCTALIVFKFDGNNGYVVRDFDDRHRHELVSDRYKRFQKGNRVLQDVHRNFIMNCSRASIGATKSYRLFKEVVGGYANIGCSKVEFKNFERDMKAFADGLDAQMIIDKYAKKKLTCPGYVFDYHVNNNNQLSRVFWADPIARRNFACFGDVMSFDATYSTNRYNMIFAPFTGKDGHGKLVTFGAALLSREDVDSYTWVFEKFKECMGHNPTMIITDQDPAMKNAIERVFVGVVHRLCMWHIMFKVPDKVPNLKNNEDFKEKLCDAVWSGLTEPIEFEEKFQSLLVEFGLTNHKWLKTMFGLRKHWIPAYFRDTRMSGLFRTTSMSESENSLFGTYMRHGSNLIEFFMRFDSAIDSQRNTHDKLNADDESSIPKMQTQLLLETHAAKVYTFHAFLMVQTEIAAACFKCRVISRSETDDCITYKINNSDESEFEAVHSKPDGTFVCSCKHFVCFGILCRHIFVILKDLGFEKIPEKYVVSRWTKLAHLRPLHEVGGDYLRQCAEIENNKKQINNLISSFYSCLALVDGDADKMIALQRRIDDLKNAFQTGDSSLSGVSTKRKLLADFYDCDEPSNVTVLPPGQVSTKGSGTHSSRIKSTREKIVEQNQKPLRLCRCCNKKVTHDSRTCPDKPPPVDAQNVS